MSAEPIETLKQKALFKLQRSGKSMTIEELFDNPHQRHQEAVTQLLKEDKITTSQAGRYEIL